MYKTLKEAQEAIYSINDNNTYYIYKNNMNEFTISTIKSDGFIHICKNNIYKSPGVYVRERPEEPTLSLNLKNKSQAISILNMIDIEIIQEYVRAKKLGKIKGDR